MSDSKALYNKVKLEVKYPYYELNHLTAAANQSFQGMLRGIFTRDNLIDAYTRFTAQLTTTIFQYLMSKDLDKTKLVVISVNRSSYKISSIFRKRILP
ncbi:hypothetical protein GJ496_011560 [Pomphorhynchus laevis]|nr:hypothetical protein GJ496_011560 [Pomphorhynchus laevis]